MVGDFWFLSRREPQDCVLAISQIAQVAVLALHHKQLQGKFKDSVELAGVRCLLECAQKNGKDANLF